MNTPRANHALAAAPGAATKHKPPARTTGPLNAYPPLEFVARVKAAAKREGMKLTAYVVAGLSAWMGDKNYTAPVPGNNAFHVGRILATDLAPLARAGADARRAILALTDPVGLAEVDLAPLSLTVTSLWASLDALGAALDELKVLDGTRLKLSLKAYAHVRVVADDLSRSLRHRAAAVRARKALAPSKASPLEELRRVQRVIADALLVIRALEPVRRGYDDALDLLPDAMDTP